MSTNTTAQVELTWRQDEAVSDLKRALKENYQAILDIKQNKTADGYLLQALVSSAKDALQACGDTKVPDSYSMTFTSSADNAKSTFSVKEVRTLLPKWEQALKKQQQVTATAENANKEKAATDDNMFRAINALVSAYNGRSEFFTDAFINDVTALDRNAMYQLERYGFPPSRMDLKPELDACIKAGVPDSYKFQMDDGKQFTLPELKKLIPKWAAIAQTSLLKNNPALAENLLTPEQRSAKITFDGAFTTALQDLKSVRSNDRVQGDFNHYLKWTITPLKNALAKAKAANIPADLIVSGLQMTIGEALVKAESFEQDFQKAFAVKDDKFEVFKNTQGPVNYKRYEEFKARYTAGLTGDKLKLMNDILIADVVYNQDPPQFLTQYYDVGKKPINTPGDFAKASIWATTNFVYASDDVLKTDPHWRVYITHFNGMKKVNETNNRGSGKVAPETEFKLVK